MLHTIRMYWDLKIALWSISGILVVGIGWEILTPHFTPGIAFLILFSTTFGLGNYAQWFNDGNDDVGNSLFLASLSAFCSSGFPAFIKDPTLLAGLASFLSLCFLFGAVMSYKCAVEKVLVPPKSNDGREDLLY